jgi:hypothetical protein
MDNDLGHDVECKGELRQKDPYFTDSEECRSTGDWLRESYSWKESASKATKGPKAAKFVKELKQRKLVEKEWLRHQSNCRQPW